MRTVLSLPSFLASIPRAFVYPTLRENEGVLLQPKIYFYIPNVKVSIFETMPRV